MAEITKVTTPMLPKENISSKLKPVTDQAFDLTDPSKIHKTDQEGKISDRQSQDNLLKDMMGRPAVAPLLKNANDMMQMFKKVAVLVEMGVSASDATKDASIRELLESLFISPKDFAKTLFEQDNASVLFKGESFDVLRDIQDNFEQFPKVKDALANLLKAFDNNVNLQNSVKTILYSCSNILDYMFSRDRDQFSNYLADLAKMLLPQKESDAFIGLKPSEQNTQNSEQAQQTQQPGQQAANTGQTQQAAQQPGQTDNTGQTQQAQQPGQQTANAGQTQQAQNPEQANVQQNGQTQAGGQPISENSGANAQAAGTYAGEGAEGRQVNSGSGQHGAAEQAQISPKEQAQLLKNNLLPLLGEIVVKYNQNESIRDTVMVVVHNIVRVDQGTPDALKSAVAKLVDELRQVANLPAGFEKELLEAMQKDVINVRNAPNTVIEKLSEAVSRALTSPDTNPAVARHAENMLISMLQNQSSLMDVLHFVLPLDTAQGHVFTEIYVDPETEEHVGKQKGQSYKIFLSVESEAHGSFELSFLATGEHIDFAMWCPEDLVKNLSGLKRQFADIMMMRGYTMNSFNVDEMKAPHSVAEVFPRLIEKKVGIDVQV